MVHVPAGLVLGDVLVRHLQHDREREVGTVAVALQLPAQAAVDVGVELEQARWVERRDAALHRVFSPGNRR